MAGCTPISVICRQAYEVAFVIRGGNDYDSADIHPDLDGIGCVEIIETSGSVQNRDGKTPANV